MTPSNTPITPEIENIADNQGNKHTVVPSDHTHAQSEVTGLVAELADKADKVHDHKRIIYTSGNQTAVVQVSKDSSNNVQIEFSIQDLGEVEFERKAVLNWNNMANAERAVTTPDATPTTNSDNLVTSGGVAAALTNKMDNKTIDSTPTLNSQNLVTSGGVAAALNSKAGATHTHIPTDIAGLVPSFVETAGDAINMDDLINDEVGLKRLIIKNVSGGHIQFGDLLTSPTLPVHPNSNASTQIDDGDYALVTIYKIDKDMDPEDEHEHDLCYFVTLDGIFGPV